MIEIIFHVSMIILFANGVVSNFFFLFGLMPIFTIYFRENFSYFLIFEKNVISIPKTKMTNIADICTYYFVIEM